MVVVHGTHSAVVAVTTAFLLSLSLSLSLFLSTSPSNAAMLKPHIRPALFAPYQTTMRNSGLKVGEFM